MKFNISTFFSRKGKKQGLVMLNYGMIKPASKPAPVTDHQIDQTIQELHQAILADRTPYGVPGKSPQQKRAPSTVEKKMADLNLEKELFKGFGWPGFKIVEHNQRQDRQLQQSDYLMLFNICIGNNIRTVEDLSKLDDQTRDTLLSRVIDKVTFLKLIKVCMEAQRDAPPHPGITRNQFISSRMHKIFNP